MVTMLDEEMLKLLGKRGADDPAIEALVAEVRRLRDGLTALAVDATRQGRRGDARDILRFRSGELASLAYMPMEDVAHGLKIVAEIHRTAARDITLVDDPSDGRLTLRKGNETWRGPFAAARDVFGRTPDGNSSEIWATLKTIPGSEIQRPDSA